MIASRKKIPRQESLHQPPVLNPFVHELHLTTLDKIRIAIFSVTIAPVRLLLVLVLLFACWISVSIGLLGLSEEDKKKPLCPWRRALRHPINLATHLTLWVIGFTVTVRNRQATASEAPILVIAPHSSFFDGIPLFWSGLPSCVTRAENLQSYVFGKLVRFLQPVCVSREDPNSRQTTISQIKGRAAAADQWPQIVIFPEGTCTNRSCLITFKGGAFYPGVPVQPVAIKYLTKPDTFTWAWQGPSALTQLWLTLCNVNNKMEVEFLPVYRPSEEEKADAKLYANNVRQVLADCLEIPATDHTFEDCRLMMKAKKTGLKMETGIIEYQKLHQKLGLNFQSAGELLTKFSQIPKLEGESISLEDFAKYLQLPVSPSLKEVFDLYDRDGQGTIDFREYVIGHLLVAQPAKTEDTIELAFNLFDEDNKGYITESELSAILSSAFNMSPQQVGELFREIDVDGKGRIIYDEFYAKAQQKPEYAKLFTMHRELNESHYNSVNHNNSRAKSE